ncbi:Putative ATPase OS=Sphingobium scionense OX=1404341 GN=GGQ90_002899 PE=4 SV=1 [Sphingobium scionense]
MQQFNLPYTIPHNDDTNLIKSDKWPLRLRHTKTGAMVDISSLSSGETTILRFLLSFFQGDPRSMRKAHPKLLLLDEVDASLHPPMVQTWLEAIHREFVLKRGIKCIIATHTPTTVAVAPGDCIYEKLEGVTAPQKIDRQTAIRKLTFGIPTLSINVNANRQVFTESDVDTMVLNELHGVLAADLGLPRNLVFSSCGLKIKPSTEDVKVGETDINTGCAIVRKIVSAVHGVTEGNVYGVVDWDLKAEDQGPVFVLAEGTHYALENVILDPLLLALLAIYERKFPEPHPRITQVTECPDSELQQLADVIAYDTLGFDKAGDITKVLYRNGRSIEVPTAMAQYPAHPLEERVVAKLPWLKANRLAEGPKFQVVKRVIFTLPEFCPMSIVELFKRIASDGDTQPGVSTQH